MLALASSFSGFIHPLFSSVFCSNKREREKEEKKILLFFFLKCTEDFLITIIVRTLMRQLQATGRSTLMSRTRKQAALAAGGGWDVSLK